MRNCVMFGQQIGKASTRGSPLWLYLQHPFFCVWRWHPSLRWAGSTTLPPPALPPQQWAGNPRMVPILLAAVTGSRWAHDPKWINQKYFLRSSQMPKSKAIMLGNQCTFLFGVFELGLVHSQLNESRLAQRHCRKRATGDGKNDTSMIWQRGEKGLLYPPIPTHRFDHSILIFWCCHFNPVWFLSVLPKPRP